MRLFSFPDHIPEGGVFPDAMIWACGVRSISPCVSEESTLCGINIPLPFKTTLTEDYRQVTGWLILRVQFRVTDLVTLSGRHVRGLSMRHYITVKD